jgi:hypothetical protein
MGFIKPTYFYLEEIGHLKPQNQHPLIKGASSNCTFLWDSRCFSICLFDRETELNSIFLTLIVAITVGQATYNIVKNKV